MSAEVPTKGRVNSLDTLRGLAIFVVIAFHVSRDFVPAPWATKLALFGNQGVQLFFLISAMTMCMMWQQRASEPNRWSRFYIRRFFRIAPLFWLAILFYTLWDAMKMGIAANQVFTWQEIALTATFLHAFSPDAINLVVPGGWSIAVEMNFYVVFPLLVYRRVSAGSMLVFAFVCYLVLGVLATPLIEHTMNPPPIFLYYSLLTEFPIFPLGMFLYAVTMRGETVNKALLAGVIAAWLGIAFAGKYMLHIDLRPFFWLQMGLIALLIYGVVRRGAYIRIMSLLGGLSYSMYLIHFAVIDVLKMLVPQGMRDGNLRYLTALAVVLLATGVLGKLSGLTFEAWSTTLGKKFIAAFGTPRVATADVGRRGTSP